MTGQIPILSFDFETHPADTDLLIQAWMPEIAEAARTHVPDDRFVAFVIAGLRVGARSKGLEGFKLAEVVKHAGYSRSTFFRLFEGYTGFLLRGYQLTCLLSIKVYERHLEGRELSLEEFCKFTADVFFGANCTIPNEAIRVLWGEHDQSHVAFHPHLSEIAPIICRYLSQNRQTAHLSVDVEELDGVIRSLDLAILNARLEDSEQWGSPYFYKKLKKMLLGYLLTCA